MQTKVTIGLITIVTMAAAAVAAAAMVVTNPAQIGPLGVTLWFVVLLVALAGVITLLLYIMKTRLENEISNSNKLWSSLRQGLEVSGVITVCLGLSSLRQLSLRDVILIVILAALAEFYFRTKQ